MTRDVHNARNLVVPRSKLYPSAFFAAGANNLFFFEKKLILNLNNKLRTIFELLNRTWRCMSSKG
jgi:hypothetical protein